MFILSYKVPLTGNQSREPELIAEEFYFADADTYLSCRLLQKFIFFTNRLPLGSKLVVGIRGLNFRDRDPKLY